MQDAIAQPFAPGEIQIPVEIRTVTITGHLKDGGTIQNEIKVKLPKGVPDLEPFAGLIWQQVGGLGKKINETTFEYHPLGSFSHFTAEFSSLISGVTLG